MTDYSLRFDDLTLGYHSHAAVHHLTGTVRKGSLTAIVGANGSGKSTLLKGIAGLLKPISGACVRRPGERVAYLPQQSQLDVTFPARVIDLVSLGLWPRRGLLGCIGVGDRQTVRQALEAVGLHGFERRSIDSLSGGQLQRALFARVLVQDADLILLDEPFNAVDSRTVADLLALVKHWQSEGRTVLVVVHDLDLVRGNFPEALLLARRPVAWGDARLTLAPENLLKARRFHEAWNEDAPWCEPEPSERPLHGAGGHSGHAHAHGHGAEAA